MSVKSINPEDISTIEVQSILTGAIAPRPIAFASTVNEKGEINLAPFSFFNAFGANPPILVFSPARRGRDGSTKHTLDNIKQTMSVVINVVSYGMVEQMNLASADYGTEINEFDKAGFTMLPSDTVPAPRVKEAPVQFECKVLNIIETGHEGGAGNLIVCKITKFHIKESILNKDGQIDPLKIDLVGRMGGEYYLRTNKENLFTVQKPLNRIGIGIDSLPKEIRLSTILTGNELGKLAGIDRLPEENEWYKRSQNFEQATLEAQILLKNNQRWEAICLLMGNL